MKRSLFVALCVVLSSWAASAQFYTVDSAGFGSCSNSGISATFICVFDGGGSVSAGSFTDINAPAEPLTSMDITVYAACDGGFNLILNGVIIANATQTATGCSCEPHSDPDIPLNLSVPITPTVQAAYVMGGINTLSLETIPTTPNGAICFYGYEMTINGVPVELESFFIE